jgi:two-component system cell cycle sensor histidine kinase/response regulator CckA
VANKHGKTKLQGGGKIKVADKAKEQLIEEIERLRQEVDKLRQEKTACKQAETALRESEARYRTILENVVEGYYEIDLAGNFTLVNDVICHNLGYSRDELIGMNNRDYMDEQTAKKVLERFAEVYTTRQSARGFDFEVIRKDGTKLFTSSSISLIRDSKGEPTGFRGVVRDVTEQRKAEEALRQSEEKYRTILESIEHGYLEVDIRGNFTFFNDSMCKILGYSRNEMIGMNNRQYMDKENARKVFQAFNKVYTTGKPTVGVDWELTRKDGTKRIVEASVSLIRDAEGEPIGFRGVVKDITERRKGEIERKTLEQRAQLATRLSIVGEMASGILHEMNNPLTSVIGFAEMLAQKDLPEDVKKYTRIINNEGKRVAAIASRMLVFAHPQKPKRLYADINQIIETTLRLQAYEMESTNIEITTRLDPDLPWTMADPGQMQQVFLNIILNARTEMKLAHGRGKLLIKTRVIDNTIQISFKDDGPGIAKKNLQRIFDPFFTTREPGKGTGLGLSICHEIITNHNGQIYARSKLRKGATFIVELPIIAEEQQLKQAAPATDKRTALAGAKRRN